MVKFDVAPSLSIDSNQNVSGAAVVRFNHGNANWRVRVSDSVKDGDVLKGISAAVKTDAFELVYDCGNNGSVVRFLTGLDVKDKRINVKYTHLMGDDHRTFLNSTMDIDDNNTARCILECKAGQRPSHKDLTLGWIHRRDDFEFEPRFNLGTESLSAGVTYRVDDDNKLRAIFDSNTNTGSLRWTNAGSLGGGGELRVTATTTMDKDGFNRLPSLVVEKHFDLDF